MGTGKSTVGRALAKRLGVSFMDLDTEIELVAGRSVAQIFERDGEAVFRRIEAETLKVAVGQCPGVIALGGGTIHQRKNLEFVKKSTELVVLLLPFPAIMERLGVRDAQRPLWSGSEALFLDRNPVLERAGIGVNVEGLSLEEAVSAVQAAIP